MSKAESIRWGQKNYYIKIIQLFQSVVYIVNVSAFIVNLHHVLVTIYVWISLPTSTNLNSYSANLYNKLDNVYSDTLESPWSPEHLLADAEGLVVEVLDELAGQAVWVVGVAVDALLLQEVDFHRHGAYTLFGLVKLVFCYCKGRKRDGWFYSET